MPPEYPRRAPPEDSRWKRYFDELDEASLAAYIGFMETSVAVATVADSEVRKLKARVREMRFLDGF